MEVRNHLDLTDFIRMHDLELKFYDESHITPYEEAYRWFLAFPWSNCSIYDGDRLAGFLADYDFTDMDWTHFDCILPVPLHIRRLRERRFNQSLILARALGRKHKLPVDFSLLKRRRFTSTQTGLDKNEREKNMKSAFEIVHPERLAGQHVILVDDVFTTGATTNECARALKKAGAGEIAVVTLARVL